MVDPAARLGMDEAEVASRVMGDEVVVVNLRTGVYYGIPGVAAVVWELVRAHHDRDEMTAVVAEHFGAAPDRVRADIDSFLADLAAEDLLVESDHPGPDPIDVTDIVDSGTYGPMTLERYDDIEELLALDPPTPGALDNLLRQPYEGDDG